MISEPEKEETKNMKEITEKVELGAYIKREYTKMGTEEDIVLSISHKDIEGGVGFRIGTDISRGLLKKMREAGVLDD